MISRVARILEAFDRNSETLTLSALANRAGLPAPTTHRLVTELTRHGLLERTDDRSIRIGLHLWELSAQRNRGTDIRDAALPFMIDLHAVLGEIVTIAVLDTGSALFLERLAPPGTTLAAGRIAERHPLHASSSGLVLLAFSPPEFQEEILAGPLEQRTPETVIDPAELRRTLTDIRRRRAICISGVGTPLWSGMAVPVVGPSGEVVAALSVVYRRGTETPAEHTPAMHTAAAGIARVLARQRPRGDGGQADRTA